MKIQKRWQRKYIALFVIMAGAFVMKACGFPPYYETDRAVLEVQRLNDFDEKTLTIDGKPLHLVYTGTTDAPVILFIHGSPGGWSAWADYLLDPDLRENAFMIAVDRPGFGASDSGMHESDLQTQTRLIMEAVKTVLPEQTKMIVVGHSYGGPVTLRMAVDYPDDVFGLTLLAPSIAPDLERVKWYNTLAGTTLARAVLPPPVDRSNQEILPLKGELEKMRPLLGSVKIPVTVIQGKKDTLVPYENAKFAQEALINADTHVHLLPDRGHFIPWEEYALVKKTLMNQLQQLSVFD